MYCDRVVLIFRGQAIAKALPDELKELSKCGAGATPTLEQAFIKLAREFGERDYL
jgi:hypothetical protein